MSAKDSWEPPAGVRFFDAHCHMQLPRMLAHAEDVVASAKRGGVSRAAVCGCAMSDWAAVERLAVEHPDFVSPQFGVHPWWAAEHAGPEALEGTADWATALENLLRQHPAAGIGECGIDSARKKSVPMDVQCDVLQQQLALARELGRPVSLHCVGAHGMLLEILQKTFGKRGHRPGLVLHSYCGSPEMVVPFARLNCFFSFSASFLHIPKHLAALCAVPRERLLLETDSPDQLPRECCGGATASATPALCPPNDSIRGVPFPSPRSDDDGEMNEPAFLPGICSRAAVALGAEVADIAALTDANARGVFDAFVGAEG